MFVFHRWRVGSLTNKIFSLGKKYSMPNIFAPPIEYFDSTSKFLFGYRIKLLFVIEHFTHFSGSEQIHDKLPGVGGARI